MPHVDEGQLHAYLDRQLEFAAADARASLEAHVASCADCATQLDEARLVHDRANALLRDTDPARIDTPPFATIAHRTAGGAGPRPRTPLQQLRDYGLAASIVLALAAGWYARVTDVPATTESPVASDPTTAPVPTAAAETATESVVENPPAPTPSRETPATSRPDASTTAAGGPSPPDVPRAAVVERRDARSEGDTPTRNVIAPRTREVVAVRGQVIDAQTRRAIAGARVTWGDLAVTTDDSGRFRLADVPIDPSELRVLAIGYSVARRAVPAGEGANRAIEVEMQPSALSLDEIVVTGVDADKTRAAQHNPRRAAEAMGSIVAAATENRIDPEEAARRFGEPLYAVTGVAISTVLLQQDRGTEFAVVRQQIGAGVLDLVHVPVTGTPAAGGNETARAVKDLAVDPQTRRGRFVITARGDFPRDSLVAFLARLGSATPRH